MFSLPWCKFFLYTIRFQKYLVLVFSLYPSTLPLNKGWILNISNFLQKYLYEKMFTILNFLGVNNKKELCSYICNKTNKQTSVSVLLGVRVLLTVLESMFIKKKSFWVFFVMELTGEQRVNIFTEAVNKCWKYLPMWSN